MAVVLKRWGLEWNRGRWVGIYMVKSGLGYGSYRLGVYGGFWGGELGWEYGLKQG